MSNKLYPTEKEKQYMGDKFTKILDQIYALTDDNGNEFSYVFHALPLRANLEYYKVIKSPMSYSKIKMAAKHNKYTNPQDFVNDLTQITWNARFFNEESSIYYQYALILNNFIKNNVIPALVNDPNIFRHDQVVYPNLGPLPGDPEFIAAVAQEQQQKTIAPESAPAAIVPSAVTNNDALFNRGNTSTPGADDELYEDEDEHEGDETKTEIVSNNRSSTQPAYTSGNNDYQTYVNQTYNPSSYMATVEETGQANLYNPPKLNYNAVPNRAVLEQWVKRGRPPIVDKPHEQRIKSIMRGLKKIKVGTKTIISFWDKLPSNSDYSRIIKNPISMLDIKGLIKQRYYKTVDAYVTDVFRLISNNRTYFSNDDFIQNNLNVLESNISRLYQIEMAKPDIEYMSGQQTSKYPLSQVVFNDRVYKVGNWVLVNNPNDPLRPVIAQIFRLWQQEKGELCMNVCWYYRPEWTVHRVDRLFLHNEVFKTGQYRDHLVSEIIGPCYVAYFTRWLKGDPGVPYDGPLFVCEFRYNDRENTFAKIRTWKACLPDEVRHLEDPIKPLSSNRILKKFPSPIKHLLLPGSSDVSPIPPPIILNLNSPPLVGGVYIPRIDDEIDTHYFDNTLTPTQCKNYVPPAANLRVSNVNDYDDVQAITSASTSQPLQFQQLSTPNGSIPVMSTQNSLPRINPVKKPQVNMQLQMQLQMQMQMQQMQLNMASQYSTGLHGSKIIKTPYNSTSYSFSQYHSPSQSLTFIKQIEDMNDMMSSGYHGEELIKRSYLNVDKFNFERISKGFKQSNSNLIEGKNLNIEKDSLVWFKGPPLKIVDRILNEDDVNSLKRVRCGHSAKYLEWKLKKQCKKD